MNLNSKEFNTIKKRRVITAKGREMIARVYHFLQDEYSFLKQFNIDKCDLSPLANITKRTAQATGVSENTVCRILREEKELPPNSYEFVNPMSRSVVFKCFRTLLGKDFELEKCPLTVNSSELCVLHYIMSGKRRASKVDVDDQTLAHMHSVIQNYQKEFHESPTLTKLNAIFKERFQFNVCLSTFRVMLMKMGYKWTKTSDKKIHLTLKGGAKVKSKSELPANDNFNQNFYAQTSELTTLK